MSSDPFKDGRTKHGMSTTPEYRAWLNARTRCTNPGHSAWLNYGGRGIVMCQEWLCMDHGFVKFYEHIGPRPSGDGWELDRINNDGHYEPGNVRWVQRRRNASNRRTNRVIEYEGKEYTLSALADLAGISPALLSYRLYNGWSVCDAVTMDAGDGNRARAKERARSRSNNRIIRYDGKSYVLAELAELAGIDSSTLQKRIDVYGWSLREAVETPTGSSTRTLNEDRVREIRQLDASGTARKELAERFGVSLSTISNVVNRKSWAHVD